MALNTPIQASSADILKMAMIEIDKKFSELNLKSKMLLQIHDELVFDLAPGEENLIEVFKNIMEEASNLKVRLVASYGIGKDWYLAK